MTRAERSERNKRAHAIRRAWTEHTRKATKGQPGRASWVEVWAVFEAMSVDDVLAMGMPDAAPEVLPAVRAVRKRRAPEHIRQVKDAWLERVTAWEALRESSALAPAGAVPGGRDTAVSYYQLTDEQFCAIHPRPVFKDMLADFYAERRAGLAATA